MVSRIATHYAWNFDYEEHHANPWREVLEGARRMGVVCNEWQ